MSWTVKHNSLISEFETDLTFPSLQLKYIYIYIVNNAKNRIWMVKECAQRQCCIVCKEIKKTTWNDGPIDLSCMAFMFLANQVLNDVGPTLTPLFLLLYIIYDAMFYYNVKFFITTNFMPNVIYSFCNHI